MQNAHKSLLDPTPTHNKFLARTSMDELQDASLTAPSAQSLGKRTTTLLEKAKAKKEAKTDRVYGTRRDRQSGDIFNFEASSDEEPGGESYTGVELQSWDQGKDNEAQELPETLRDPRGRRPQGGSSNTIPTVPNSTPPQPFNSSATRTTSDREHHEPYPQFQSDERMPTPTTPSHSRSTASSSYKATQRKAVIQPPAVPNLYPDKLEAQQRPTPSGSAIAQSKATIVSTGETMVNEVIDASRSSERAESTSLPTFHTAGLFRPMVVLPEAPNESLSMNNVSMPAPDVHVTKTVKISDERKLRQHNQTAADDLGSDDMSIGLPKEQYKPRPSRSRGTQNDDELMVPVDYSKRPETVAMGRKETKKKGCKQSVSAEVIAKTEREEQADEKDRDVSESEVTLSEIKPPGSPTNAEDQIGDVRPATASKTETIEVDDHSTQGSTKKGPKPKRQRGRPKKAAGVDLLAPRVEQGMREDHSEPKKHTASTSRKPAKGGQSKKSQSVVDSDSENEEENMEKPTKCDHSSKTSQSDVNSDSESEAVTSRRLSKRRQSGKKPWSVLDSDSESGAEIPEEHKPDPQGHHDPGPESIALKESSGNRGNAKLTSKTTNNAVAAQPETLPPVTPPKAAASTPKGPIKNSPVSTGLSKYRVGLSKRARIEPLLRIVRK